MTRIQDTSAASSFDYQPESAKASVATVQAALLKSGVDVNAKGSDGKTALLAAAEMGSTDAIEVLVQSGAQLDETTADGKTAVMAAVATNQKDAIDLLTQKGADINRADNNGNTP